jgi:ribosome recycling factor
MYANMEEKMEKTVEHLKADYAAVRAGRANPALLDKAVVDYYGVPTPIGQIGALNVPDARTILIQPWDASVLKQVEKAILASDLGLTPNNDGKSIRLNFPPLTEERRRELAKSIAKRAEEAKVAVRNLRREALEDLKKQKKNGDITEDDLDDMEKRAQKTTDKYVKAVDDVFAAKEKEIMEV